jgi:hypothetical protein
LFIIFILQNGNGEIAYENRLASTNEHEMNRRFV